MSAEMPRSLAQCPALVLNADYRPLSYFPLSIWSWQDAIKALVRDHVTVLSEYNQVVRSPSQEFRLPSVLVLKEYVPERRTPAFTRMNVFLRDRWECQYCGERFSTPELTFDHLIPRSRGGHTAWNNIVTACYDCNLRKGDRLSHECGMVPATFPVAPTMQNLQRRAQEFPPHFRHESWRDYVYWNTDLVDQDER
jgi:5-methylcytosine-specific restriction endonuclease McrA